MTSVQHHHHLTHASAGALGALLVGIGALMLLADAVGPTAPQRFTFGGTIRTPRLRLFAGFELVGAIFVAAGSGILLFSATDLSVLVVLIAAGVGGILVYVAMALQLRAHHRLLAEENKGPRRSLLWCRMHPLWKPTD